MSPDDLEACALQLLNFTAPQKVILVEGEMGSGKTTLIKSLCKALGSEDNFSSPTFSIVNEYRYPGGKIYHMDLYRLHNLEEFLDIGGEDYLYSGEYCFVEWPELVKPMLEGEYVNIQLHAEENIHYIRATKKRI